MLEVYAFLAMFAAQIVVLSVLHPMRLVGRVRAYFARYPAERFPRLYPGGSAGHERQLDFYRLVNWAIAVVGLVLLGGFYRYMQRPDWDDGPVEALVTAFFMLQLVPVLFYLWKAECTNRRIRSALREETRTAVLRRRTLFDFVSPFVVFVTLLSYFLFVAFVIYIQRDPFPGFKGYFNIVIVTALYAATGLAVFGTLYGRKGHPLQTYEDRIRTIEVAVKVCVYSCLAAVVFLSLNFTLVLLDLQRWEPLAQSAFLVIFSLLYIRLLIAPPIELNHDRLGSRPAA